VDEQCTFAPVNGTFHPVLEWWMSSFEEDPASTLVFAVPAVGQVTDDDGGGDVDAEDVPDIVFTTYEGEPNYQGRLRVVSGDGSKLHWTAGDVDVDGVLFHPYCYASPSIADADADGDVEIAMTVSSGNSDGGPCNPGMFDDQGHLAWVNTDVSIPCGGIGPAFGDVDGDGATDVVFGSAVLDPMTGETLAKGSYGVGYGTGYANSGAHSFPIDIDLDGVQEIVAGSSIYNPDGSLRCYTGFGDIVSAFASAAPDVVPLLVETCTFECDAGALQVAVQVGNGGLAEVAPGVGVALYDGDGVMVGEGVTAAAIPSGGSSETLPFRVDATVRALTLSVDAADALAQCREDNNTLEITEGRCT